ncbi:MAG TPA: transglycosylase SLT domain-containing protein [Gemmatimonadaceae bacterium]|nr:transglycosylase SLT domain-containing protein [Gemmatimonadaceae bacterium]
MRLCRFIAALLLTTACGGRRPEAATAPAPQVVSAQDSAAQAAAAMTTTLAGDSAAAIPVSDSEVVHRAAAMFDGVPAVPDSSTLPADARATWDIDVRSYETHEMVAQYIGIFTGRAREYMQRSMSRGTRYDALLRSKFREAGLPEDMTYLALIESSYMPHAYSRAAAVGMWQFMAPTAREIGMRVDWWVDERRDPMRATKGAIDFLTDLHDAYGSWYLAAAAYNGGPGRVSRGLKRFSEEMDGSEGEDRFFALAEQRYLPSETKAYVPKLIAAAMVAKEPARYGLRVDTLPAYAYDSVDVPAGTALAAVAKAAGTTIGEIGELNPHYLRGVTPPGEVSEVRIPVGAAAAFPAGFAALAATEREGWREQRIETMRSAQAIAEESGIPVKALRWVNPRLQLDRRGRVRAGTMLRIPTMLAVSGARDVPDPSLARYGSATRALVAKRVRVRSGESLSSVARRSGVSVATLRALNGIRGSRVRAGQVLVVRRPSRSAVTAARRAAAARSRAGNGARCTSRVVRVRGKRRTVTGCASATRMAKASGAKASSKKSSARGTTRKAGTRKASTSKGKAKPKQKPRATAARTQR